MGTLWFCVSLGMPLCDLLSLSSLHSLGSSADVPKAVVLLDPPWVRILEDDHVALTCHVTHPSGDNSTLWFHNKTLISSQTSTYIIRAAKVEDSGKYQCQMGLSPRSDPVLLEVHAGWLVLQTSQWVFQKGESIRLRCHSWKNRPVYKVTYLKNGRGQKYSHQNSEFYIPEATLNHTGSYFCRGLIGANNKSSEIVHIVVQDLASPSISPLSLPWHQITFCLVMGLLFAVDTGLYFFVHRDLRRSMGNQRALAFIWTRDPQDK
ncbi:low affinity immunoglobulin gamma Fc region receptor III-A [Ctenodactylus gundi]